MVLTEENKIRERWREHFYDVMNFRNDIEHEDENIQEIEPAEYDIEGINMESITIEEVKQAIKNMKNNNAAGIDNIVAEMWKVTY